MVKYLDQNNMFNEILADIYLFNAAAGTGFLVGLIYLALLTYMGDR